MKINVAKVAKLANLSLSSEEKEKFEKQLSSILDYVKKLEEVDTSKVDPTSQVTNLENITRDDKISPSLSQKKAPSNSKSNHNGYFKTKAILDS